MLFLVTFTFTLTWLNWRGLALVGNTAILLAVFTLLPFAVMFALGAPQIEWGNLTRGRTEGAGAVQWGTYLNVMFWNLK